MRHWIKPLIALAALIGCASPRPAWVQVGASHRVAPCPHCGTAQWEWGSARWAALSEPPEYDLDGPLGVIMATYRVICKKCKRAYTLYGAYRLDSSLSDPYQPGGGVGE